MLDMGEYIYYLTVFLTLINKGISANCMPGIEDGVPVCRAERLPYNTEDYGFSCPRPEHTCVPFYQCPEVMFMLRSDDDKAVEQAQLRHCGDQKPYGPLVCCFFYNTEQLPLTSADYSELPVANCGLDNMYLISAGYLQPENSNCENGQNDDIEGRRCVRQAKSNTTRTKRLIGGAPSRLGEWPWLVPIYFNHTEKIRGSAPIMHAEFRCVGTIINERYVLTSSTCISQPYDYTGSKPIRVTVGDFEIVDKGTFEIKHKPQYIEVDRAIPKRDFTYEDYADVLMEDIGLIRLAEPIKFNGFAQPICLPTSEAPDEVKAETIAYSTIAAYNEVNDEIITDSTKAGNAMYEVLSFPRHFQILPTNIEDCVEYYSRYYDKPFLTLNEKEVLCAGYEDSPDGLCGFDQGAPLMRAAEDGRMHLVGVASQSGLEDCRNSRPYIFTRIDANMDWIIRTMKKFG